MGEEEFISTNEVKKHKRRNRKLLFLVTCFSAVLLIVSAYAWFSSSLNVKIMFVKMSVASDSGLFISLDGINFSDSVLVSIDTTINDLTPVYPNHTNQWATTGLWPVSSNGIRNSNMDKFDLFEGQFSRTKSKYPSGDYIRLLTTFLSEEEKSYALNSFISFDIFLKNQTTAPNGVANEDNLYFDDGTQVAFADDIEDAIKEEMQGLLNSARIGIVKIGTVPINADVNTIQNVGCNGNCQSIIYEPNSTNHSSISTKKAYDYGIIMRDGFYTPTYAIIGEGKRLEHTNGHFGTGIPLIETHFALQNTIREEYLDVPIFQLTQQTITKLRVYIWIEGQDIDSLETYSRGAELDVGINFTKDLAGYE